MLWLVIGIIIGVGLTWLVYGVKAGKMQIKWYQLLLGALAVITLLLTIENYVGFVEEMEPHAASFTVWAMGLPAIILGALAVGLPKIIGKVKSQPKKTKAAAQ